MQHRVERPGHRPGRHRGVGRREVARVDRCEPGWQCLVGRHPQHGARRRQEGGDQAGRTGGKHRQVQQQVPWAAEHGFGECSEDVAGVFGIAQPDAVLADPGVHLTGRRDDEVGQQDRQHAQQRRPARGFGRSLGLLVDRQAGVPAPEREDRPGQPGDERGQRQAGGTEPTPFERYSGRGRRGLDDRQDGERGQRQQLESDQDELDPFGGGDTAVGDPGGEGQKSEAGGDIDPGRLPQSAELRVAEEVAEELIEKLDGHPGEVGQHDGGCQNCGPTADPAHVGSEGLGGPGERGAAVRHHLVEFAVGVGGEEHRQEAGDDHNGHLVPGLADQDADGRGQCIGRCDRGDPQDNATQDAD